MGGRARSVRHRFALARSLRSALNVASVLPPARRTSCANTAAESHSRTALASPSVGSPRPSRLRTSRRAGHHADQTSRPPGAGRGNMEGTDRRARARTLFRLHPVDVMLSMIRMPCRKAPSFAHKFERDRPRAHAVRRRREGPAASGSPAGPLEHIEPDTGDLGGCDAPSAHRIVSTETPAAHTIIGHHVRRELNPRDLPRRRNNPFPVRILVLLPNRPVRESSRVLLVETERDGHGEIRSNKHRSAGLERSTGGPTSRWERVASRWWRRASARAT